MSDGNNVINLASCWVPIMAETSHFLEQVSRAGTEGRKRLEQAFTGGSGSSSVFANLGSQLSQQLMSGFTRGMGNSEVLGISKMTESLSRGFEGVRGRTEAAEAALQKYKRAHDTLTTAINREIIAQSRLNDLKEKSASGTQVLSAQAALEGAHLRVARATEANSTAHEHYRESLGRSSSSMMSFALSTGVVSGAVSAGINLATQAIEKMGELTVEAFSKTIEMGAELADKIVEIGETFEGLEFKLEEFTDKSGEAFEELNRNAANVFRSLDTDGANLGQTLAVLAQRLDLTGEPLERLTRHVVELSDRFGQVNVSHFAGLLEKFNASGKDADDILAAWVQSARKAGLGINEMIDPLSAGGDAFKEMGLNAQQAGELIAGLTRRNIDAGKAVQGFAAAEKVFAEKHMTFKEGMEEAAKEIEHYLKVGDKESAEELSEKLFGKKWIQGLEAIKQYLEIADKAPDAFNATGDSIDDLVHHTESLRNKWEEVWNQVKTALHPIGTAAVDVIGAGLKKLEVYVKAHAAEISLDIKHLGQSFIRELPTIKKWAVDFLDIIAPVADGVAAMMYATVETVTLAIKAIDQPLKIIAASLPDWAPGAKDIKELSRGIDGAVADLSKLGDSMKGLKPGNEIDRVKEWVQRQHTDVPELTRDWDHLWDSINGRGGGGFHVGASLGQSPLAGVSGSTGEGGSAGIPGGPGGGGGDGSFPPRVGGGGLGGAPGDGGSVKDQMEGRIVQEGHQFGLSDTEIRMILAVGKHESNWSGPGFMGFGPEAKAAGLNFDNNPLGAVDQFFKQYMSRKPAGLNPNDPNAVANYIWHTVHHAADPNYGQELLGVFNAGSFADGGPVNGQPGPFGPGGGGDPQIPDWWKQRLKADLPIDNAWMPNNPHDWGPGMPPLPWVPGSHLKGKRGIDGFALGGGPKGTDTVPAWLTPGEFVINADATKKFLPLLKRINYLHPGGQVPGQGEVANPGGLDIKGAQVDTIAVAEAVAQSFGLADIKMYRAPDGYNEHASGEAADVMIPGWNTPQGKQMGDAVKQFALSNSAAFGVQYALWQQRQWNPDGSSSPIEDRGSPTQNHMDHVHIRTEGGGYPAGGGPGAQGAGTPASGRTSTTPAPAASFFATGGTFPGMAGTPLSGGGPSSGLTFTAPGGGSGGRGGDLLSMLGLGHGGHGGHGLSPDEIISRNRELRHATEAKADADAEVAKEEQRIKDLTAERDAEKAKGPLLGDSKKVAELEKQLAEATERLTKARRTQTDATEDLQTTQFKTSEPAKGDAKWGGKDSDMISSWVGGLGKGIGQLFGMGDIFNKPPGEWGIVKLFQGLAKWGFGETETWSNIIGGGGSSITGYQALPGFNSVPSANGGVPGLAGTAGGANGANALMSGMPGGGGGGGPLGSLDPHSLPGVKAVWQATQHPGLGTSQVAGTPTPVGNPTGAKTAGDTHNNYDSRIIIAGNNYSSAGQLAGPISNIQNAQTYNRSPMGSTTPGGLPAVST